MDADKAVKDFEKKFKDKTKNDWKNRENFVEHKGKYTLIEMDSGGGEEETVADVPNSVSFIYFFNLSTFLPCPVF